jgi:BlaI family penicillinase repressor
MINPDELPRRERQLLDAVYELGEGSAAEIMNALTDPPSYSAVRAMLVRLEDKGLLRHREEEGRYVYAPVLPKQKARDSALRQLVKTFFDDSPASAAQALLGMPRRKLTAEEIETLERAIAKAKKESSR